MNRLVFTTYVKADEKGSLSNKSHAFKNSINSEHIYEFRRVISEIISTYPTVVRTTPHISFGLTVFNNEGFDVVTNCNKKDLKRYINNILSMSDKLVWEVTFSFHKDEDRLKLLKDYILFNDYPMLDVDLHQDDIVVKTYIFSYYI